VLGRGAVVLLISDGWDRGEPEVLGQEMGRLHRSCHRLIWLNPLLGSLDYEPLTRGMVAALPHVDDFLPVHNLASLEDLAARLSNVGRTREPDRRGRPRQDHKCGAFSYPAGHPQRATGAARTPTASGIAESSSPPRCG